MKWWPGPIFAMSAKSWRGLYPSSRGGDSLAVFCCFESFCSPCNQLYHIVEASLLGRAEHHRAYAMSTNLENNGEISSGEFGVSCFAQNEARDVGQGFVGVDRSGFRAVERVETKSLLASRGKCFWRSVRCVREELRHVARGSVGAGLRCAFVEPRCVKEIRMRETDILYELIHAPHCCSFGRRAQILLAYRLFGCRGEDVGALVGGNGKREINNILEPPSLSLAKLLRRVVGRGVVRNSDNGALRQ